MSVQELKLYGLASAFVFALFEWSSSCFFITRSAQNESVIYSSSRII